MISVRAEFLHYVSGDARLAFYVLLGYASLPAAILSTSSALCKISDCKFCDAKLNAISNSVFPMLPFNFSRLFNGQISTIDRCACPLIDIQLVRTAANRIERERERERFYVRTERLSIELTHADIDWLLIRVATYGR